MGSRKLNAKLLNFWWKRNIPQNNQLPINIQCRTVTNILTLPHIFHKTSKFHNSSYNPLRQVTKSNKMNEIMTDEETQKPIGPVIMKLNSQEFMSLFTPGLKKLQELFSINGFELKIAGGAVRDLLSGIKPKDVDFASTATPNEMIEMFQKEEIRLINENGNSHGTVTCRLEEENFEVTTLRIDKVTDGRHAEVEFTKNWFLDASRRDLTINSLFLDLNGNVIDYFNGNGDLLAKKVRFVGDAATRICEDYLRILRFFRFFGRIADETAEFDVEAIEAIKANGQGLMGISGPRIWMEMTQILNGRFIAKVMRKMVECDILQYIGFPKEVDIDLFERIYNNTTHLNTNHMTYASALLDTEADVLKLEKRVQFSRDERKISLFIVKYRDQINPADPARVKFCRDILVDVPPHEGRHTQYLLEVLKYIGDFETMLQIQDWKIPKFPVTGKMLLSAGVPKGKTVGIVREIVRGKWKENHYLSTIDELLEEIPKILEEL